MKAISIRQPWASLIMGTVRRPGFGIKNVENRTWSTDYRGPLLIHAAKTFGRAEREDAEIMNLDPTFDYPLGYLIGLVGLAGCRMHNSDIDDVLSPWHNPGCYGLYLAGPPRPLAEPIPYKGQLGLFEVPDSIIGRKRWFINPTMETPQ